MQKRKIWYPLRSSSSSSASLWWKLAIVLLLAIGAFVLMLPYVNSLKGFFSSAGKNVVKVVSQQVGKQMKVDQYGNVNALLIGYGGGEHAGGYLADTLMVASWNPNKWAVSLLSIPRDLYVTNPLGGAARINAVFSQIYGYHKKDLPAAANDFLILIQKITGLEIPYYATIDFSGFKQIIDTLWGIEVDVPSALHDLQYPDENLRGYDPLHVEAGLQLMDGALALKYARSRHAPGHASDFDRSLRQQLILAGIKNKLLSSENLSLDRVKQLYADFTAIVKTNVALDEMLWTVQFLDGLQIFSFGINNAYNPDSYQNMQKGAFLYNPPREQFNGASVMIPFGASAGNLSHYDRIHTYVDFAAHVQGFLLDKAKIAVSNGISKEALRAQGMQNIRLAGKLAAKMKRYGLDIAAVNNVDPQEKTQIIINTTSEEAEGYEGTIQALKNFLLVDEVVYNTWVVKVITDEYGSEVNIFTGHDFELVLWASYLSGLKLEPFKELLEIKYR